MRTNRAIALQICGDCAWCSKSQSLPERDIFSRFFLRRNGRFTRVRFPKEQRETRVGGRSAMLSAKELREVRFRSFTTFFRFSCGKTREPKGKGILMLVFSPSSLRNVRENAHRKPRARTFLSRMHLTPAPRSPSSQEEARIHLEMCAHRAHVHAYTLRIFFFFFLSLHGGRVEVTTNCSGRFFWKTKVLPSLPEIETWLVSA